MATKSKSSKAQTDTYMELVLRLPLKPIKTDSRHTHAVAMIEQLMGGSLKAGAGDYLDTLILLTNKYEDENHSPVGIHLTPRQALKAIMNLNGLSQAQIGKIIGSESTVSMFLKGERELSQWHIKAIVDRFGVSCSSEHLDGAIFKNEARFQRSVQSSSVQWKSTRVRPAHVIRMNSFVSPMASRRQNCPLAAPLCQFLFATNRPSAA